MDISDIFDDDLKKMQELKNEVPAEAHQDLFFEEVETFIDVLSYYANCPLNKKFDEDKGKKYGNGN